MDILGVYASRWAEDVVMGKRHLEVVPSLTIPMGERLMQFRKEWGRPGAETEKRANVDCLA